MCGTLVVEGLEDVDQRKVSVVLGSSRGSALKNIRGISMLYLQVPRGQRRGPSVLSFFQTTKGVPVHKCSTIECDADAVYFVTLVEQGVATPEEAEHDIFPVCEEHLVDFKEELDARPELGWYTKLKEGCACGVQ